MADLADILADLKKTRLSGANCKTMQATIRAINAFHSTVEDLGEELLVQITNIINNGGGGATSPAYVIRALVNQVGGVPATQETFPFDGETLLYSITGSLPTIADKTARNTAGRFLQENEVVKLVSFNGTLWLADKISENTIAAQVVGTVATDDPTFTFQNAIQVGTGGIPAGGTGTAINVPGNAYAPGEWLVLELLEDASTGTITWAVVQDLDNVGGGGGGTSLFPDYGIYADLFTNQNKVAIDFSPGTNHDPDGPQVFGHNDSNEIHWYNLDIIEINLV